MAMMMGVTTLMTAEFDVISVKTEMSRAISSAMADIGRGANTVSTAPRYRDRPDACDSNSKTNLKSFPSHRLIGWR